MKKIRKLFAMLIFLGCLTGLSFPAAAENVESGTDNEDDIEISKEYSVYGVWEGYDEDSEMMNRGVKDLAKLAGQEYYILNQIDENGENRKNGQALYKKSGPLTMYRTLEFDDTALPAGTYYLEYEADDMFMRPFVLDRVQVSWDGEKVTLPEGVSWEGEEILL